MEVNNPTLISPKDGEIRVGHPACGIAAGRDPSTAWDRLADDRASLRMTNISG
jgi:hypothetical protein